VILHLGKTSVYIAYKLKYLRFFWLPKYSYFDGGSYFKLSFYWLKSLIEFSRSKKNNRVYKKITKEKLDKILKLDKL